MKNKIDLTNFSAEEIEKKLAVLERSRNVQWEIYRQLTNPADKEVIAAKLRDIDIEIGNLCSMLDELQKQ